MGAQGPYRTGPYSQTAQNCYKSLRLSLRLQHFTAKFKKNLPRRDTIYDYITFLTWPK